MTLKNIVKLILCISIPLAIGFIGAYATASSVNDWYVTLAKPSFNPPNYLFGPVWTILYVLMGISFYRVLTKANDKALKTAWYIFGLQLFLNLCWSFIFFKFNLLGFAMIEIMLLWLSILYMIVVFARIDKPAAYLQLPYLLWVSFAAVLNGAIWLLNS